MKHYLIALAFFLALTEPATAQEYAGCFMTLSDGSVLNLDHLCPPAQSEAIAVTPAPLTPEQNSLEQTRFADAFCRAREDGASVSQANDAASGSLVGRGVELTVEWVTEAYRRVDWLCPGMRQ